MKKDYYFVSQVLAQPKEVKIEIPTGYEIDREKSTFEKIVFKKKEDTKPRSWEEYCDNFRGEFYYIRDNGNNIGDSFTPTGLMSAYRNTLPSKELAEVFLAMMQLMSLRQDWIHRWSVEQNLTKDWEPDWNKFREDKWCIINNTNKLIIGRYGSISKALSFPTEEMVEDFMNCFKDLLEIAKPLI